MGAPDVTFASTTVYAFLVDHNRQLWIGFDTNGSGSTSDHHHRDTKRHGGEFLSYPRVFVQGRASCATLENLTTAYRVWFNLTVVADEVVTFDLRRGYKTMTSSLNAATRVSRFVAGDLGSSGYGRG